CPIRGDEPSGPATATPVSGLSSSTGLVVPDYYLADGASRGAHLAAGLGQGAGSDGLVDDRREAGLEDEVGVSGDIDDRHLADGPDDARDRIETGAADDPVVGGD